MKGSTDRFRAFMVILHLIIRGETQMLGSLLKFLSSSSRRRIHCFDASAAPCSLKMSIAYNNFRPLGMQLAMMQFLP